MGWTTPGSAGRYPAGMLTVLRDVVRSMRPGTLSPSILSFSRFSGQSIFSIESWNERMRASTDGLGSKFPTLLFNRNGAVDHTLMSEGGRVYPRPPAGIVYGRVSPVIGWCTVIVPTDGRSLYDFDEKFSQMFPASALVASGLHALVSSSVTGTRASVDR